MSAPDHAGMEAAWGRFVLARTELEAFDARYRGVSFLSKSRERRQLVEAMADAHVAYTRAMVGDAPGKPPQRHGTGRKRKIRDPDSILRAYDECLAVGLGGTQEEVAHRLNATDVTLRKRLREWKMEWPPTPEEMDRLP